MLFGSGERAVRQWVYPRITWGAFLKIADPLIDRPTASPTGPTAQPPPRRHRGPPATAPRSRPAAAVAPRPTPTPDPPQEVVVSDPRLVAVLS